MKKNLFIAASVVVMPLMALFASCRSAPSAVKTAPEPAVPVVETAVAVSGDAETAPVNETLVAGVTADNETAAAPIPAADEEAAGNASGIAAADNAGEFAVDTADGNLAVESLAEENAGSTLAEGNPAEESGAVPEEVEAVVYQVGGLGPAGGIIFYDKGDDSGGWRYLEAAPADTDRKAPMGRVSLRVTDDSLGAGLENTRKIVEYLAQEGRGGNTAACYCDQLEVNGFDDWYLPSWGEMRLINANLSSRGIGDFRPGMYWVSYSVGDSGYDYLLDKSLGTAEHRVRAVRRF